MIVIDACNSLLIQLSPYPLFLVSTLSMLSCKRLALSAPSLFIIWLLSWLLIF